MKLLRSHGRVENNGINYFSSNENSDYIYPGHNLRFPTISAALGISQLNKFEKIKEMRIKNAEYLTNNLSDIKDITFPKVNKKTTHVYQMYTIGLKDKQIRDNLQKHLEKKGIMSKIYFTPIHLSELYTKRYEFKKGDLPQTEKISESILTIPMYPKLKKEELDYIILSIGEFFRK
jgi:perosamine synthetase